jgi:hypothetical protein
MVCRWLSSSLVVGVLLLGWSAPVAAAAVGDASPAAVSVQSDNNSWA